MTQIRDIKKRMVAVSTIQRITKTMQMIATARFTAAAHRAKASRPYTDTIRRLVGELARASDDVAHPLIDGPREPVRRERLLVITSDRGLCGAFNANVLRLMLGHIRGLRKKDVAFDLATSGKKAPDPHHAAFPRHAKPLSRTLDGAGVPGGMVRRACFLPCRLLSYGVQARGQESEHTLHRYR